MGCGGGLVGWTTAGAGGACVSRAGGGFVAVGGIGGLVVGRTAGESAVAGSVARIAGVAASSRPTDGASEEAAFSPHAIVESRIRIGARI